jgi:hypothetical protein
MPSHPTEAFIDFSNDLNYKPKQLMAMLEKVDNDSRLVRFKVVPNIVCKDLEGRKTEPNDCECQSMSRKDSTLFSKLEASFHVECNTMMEDR